MKTIIIGTQTIEKTKQGFEVKSKSGNIEIFKNRKSAVYAAINKQTK